MDQGWSPDYYFISEYLAQRLVGAKVVSVKGGYEENYEASIKFDTGLVLHWYEDSEGPGIWIDEEEKV